VAILKSQPGGAAGAQRNIGDRRNLRGVYAVGRLGQKRRFRL